MIRIINHGLSLIKHRPIYTIINAKNYQAEKLIYKATFNFSKISRGKPEIKLPSINISKLN